ncbi:hypothetical protein U9M48_031350 [Paspalum notatum var. saurae]|uniref:Uncharacterized protein n=1 Tax=Paspalum notatum var. saurae TaxID=547442 RepID=A0AAQ3U2V8_PASNO
MLPARHCSPASAGGAAVPVRGPKFPDATVLHGGSLPNLRERFICHVEMENGEPGDGIGSPPRAGGRGGECSTDIK